MSIFIRTFFIGIALLGLSVEVHAQAANDVVCNKCVHRADIANAAVATGKIKNLAVDSSKLADKAVTTAKIAGSAIGTAKIKNGAVTFKKLSTQVQDNLNGSIGGIILEQTSVTDGSGVAAFSCPANSLVGSANCFCEGDGETSNFGVLTAWIVAGNGGVAGCFPEGTLFDPQLPLSPVTLTLVCVSAVQNDGTPIVPTPVGVNPLGLSIIEKGGVDLERA